jgi:hypothetical protein
MTVQRWTGKDLKESGRGIIKGLTQNLPGIEETLSHAIRCSTEIRTHHLQKTRLECCCYFMLLGLVSHGNVQVIVRNFQYSDDMELVWVHIFSKHPYVLWDFTRYTDLDAHLLQTQSIFYLIWIYYYTRILLLLSNMSLLVYLFTWKAIKLTVIIIEKYPCYQLRTKFIEYPSIKIKPTCR